MNKWGLFLFAISAMLMVSCSEDSVTEEFNEANQEEVKKLIQKVEFKSSEINIGNYTFTVNYDANNKVTKVSNGLEVAELNYEDGKLATVTEGDNPFSIDQLYQTPFEIFETGDVLEYDDNGNPKQISFWREKTDIINGEVIHISEELFATVTYDRAPNPYFFTFDAAGLIDILDDLQTIFNLITQHAKLAQARALFPLNNIKSIVYTDEDGRKVGELQIDYVYDADNYPTFATFTVETEDEPLSVHTAEYFYKD